MIVFGGGAAIAAVQGALGGFGRPESTDQANIVFVGVPGHRFTPDANIEAEFQSQLESAGLEDPVLDVVANKAYRGRTFVGGAIALELAPDVATEEGFAEEWMEGYVGATGQQTATRRIRGVDVHEALAASDHAGPQPHMVLWIRGDVVVMAISEEAKSARRLAAAMIAADRGF